MPPSVTLAKTGRVIVWGDNSYEQIGDAPKTNDFVKVVPGGARQSLAIHQDRSLTLWGGKNSPAGEPPVPALPPLPGVRFLDAALGLQQVVGIKEDGSLEVYPPPSGPSSTPPVGRFIAVASAGGHSIALDEDGALHPWGNSPTASIPVPLGVFTKVRARGNYVLALSKEDQVLFGWGGVFAGPLDAELWDGWLEDGLGHWFIEGPFKDMDAGIVQRDFMLRDATSPIPMPHVLALHECGKVEGWGANNFGETSSPPGRFQAIAAGKSYSLGLDEDGFLHEWGRDLRPITTSIGTANRQPRRPLPKGRFVSISAGGEHAVALRPGPRIVVGPDFRELTTLESGLDTPAVHSLRRTMTGSTRVARNAGR